MHWLSLPYQNVLLKIKDESLEWPYNLLSEQEKKICELKEWVG